MSPQEISPQEVESWLVAWFSRREGVAAKGPLDPAANYLELGLIDSLGLMELIASLETAFQMRFTEDHFQDPRFATINGLAELVAERAGASR